MPKIFCSNKLSKYLGVKADLGEVNHNGDEWNGHLFSVNRGKYIIFSEKRTLYSFVLIDVLKKDLKNFNKVFIDGYINQLKRDFKINPDKEKGIINDYQNIYFSETDNDKKVIGSMNDFIQSIKYFDVSSVEGSRRMKDFLEIHMNEMPMGALKYKNPKEMMSEKLFKQ